MRAASPRTKWSEGKTATVASGSRHEIQCAGSRTPAAVPRSDGWTRTCGRRAPANSAAMYGASTCETTTTVRSGGILNATRSRVWRSIDREPMSAAYCFGRSSPWMSRTRGRRRAPRPPASTMAHSCSSCASGATRGGAPATRGAVASRVSTPANALSGLRTVPLGLRGAEPFPTVLSCFVCGGFSMVQVNMTQPSVRRVKPARCCECKSRTVKG
jgi:hypothetical protein